MALRRALASATLAKLPTSTIVKPALLPSARGFASLSSSQLSSTRSASPPYLAMSAAAPVGAARSYSTGGNTATQTASSPPPPLLVQAKDLISSSSTSPSSITYLDATWFMPNLDPPRSGLAEFAAGPRIPKAQFWDLDAIASPNERGLKHMMPDGEVFAREAAARGITPSTHVVVYDTRGVFSSPRAAFTFAAFGHARISILDGGLPAWIQAGGEVEEGKLDGKEAEHGVRAAESAHYPAPTLKSTWIRSYDEMVANARMGSRGQKVLDARPKARFDGTAPEPRAGLSSGHIPSSLSLPFSSVLSSHALPDDVSSRFPTLPAQYTTLASQTDIWRAMSQAVGGMDALEQLRHDSSSVEEERVGLSLTCGSGMTAAVLWAAAQGLGIKGAIYDESWTGWAARRESPIDKTQPEEEEE